MLLHTSTSPGSLVVRAAVCEKRRGYCEPVTCERRAVLHSPKTRADKVVFDGRDDLASVGRSLLCSATRRGELVLECGAETRWCIANIQFVLMLGKGRIAG